jgi:hypothetical protein
VTDVPVADLVLRNAKVVTFRDGAGGRGRAAGAEFTIPDAWWLRHHRSFLLL